MPPWKPLAKATDRFGNTRVGNSDRVSDPQIPDKDGTIEIPDAPGWRYAGIAQSGDQRSVALLHESGFQTSFQVPDFVSQGQEIGDIARIVAAAWTRQEALKGVGG